MSSDTPFGPDAYFYAGGVGRIFRVAEAQEFGIVDINEGLISMAGAPFRSVKQSGAGRNCSKSGIEAFLELTYMAISGLTN